MLRADVASSNTYEHGYFKGETCALTGDVDVLDDLMTDDIFVAEVEVSGLYEYTSTLGANLSTPWLSVRQIRRIEVQDE